MFLTTKSLESGGWIVNEACGWMLTGHGRGRGAAKLQAINDAGSFSGLDLELAAGRYKKMRG
jgi:hypothetical protein